MTCTHLDISLLGPSNEELLSGVQGHAANGGVMRVECVSWLSLPYIKERHIALLATRDKNLVLGSVENH